jgi:hypothetical protein
MSNIDTIGYYDFIVQDYTGSTTSLSSYNLDITPVQFIPVNSSTVDTSTRFVWSTGDGTFLDEYSPTYTYKNPG